MQWKQTESNSDASRYKNYVSVILAVCITSSETRRVWASERISEKMSFSFTQFCRIISLVFNLKVSNVLYSEFLKKSENSGGSFVIVITEILSVFKLFQFFEDMHI